VGVERIDGPGWNAAVIQVDLTLVQGSFTLEIRERFDRRVTALFGPSGAGKTTVLDAIAGLRSPSRGVIAINGRTVFDGARQIDTPPYRRQVGYVTQDVALFPHMNVRRNILYGRRRGQTLPLDTVTAILEVAPLLDRAVAKLSGGERQRVALARALMSSPDLLLLDEPLAAVDVQLRSRILPYLERVRDELRVPIVYVSHDRDEVRRFADHVYVLANGRVVKAGSPDVL
jgi:molybdate transport system ATP-binding protein